MYASSPLRDISSTYKQKTQLCRKKKPDKRIIQVFTLHFLHSVSRKLKKCDTQGKVTRKAKKKKSYTYNMVK
jgi:hypothetical protein